jgi:OOP family OmpA-OmpF porin
MKFFKYTLAIALLPLLAACAGGPNIEATKSMANKGSAFNGALQQEYIALAMAEAEEWDMEDAHYFNNKALAAAKGDDVQPQAIKERKITGDARWDLEAARQALRASLLAGSKDYAPKESARAQAMFDCWIQEQEENDNPADVAACMNGFNEALAKVEGMRLAMKAKAPMKKMMDLPAPYTVYFDFDSFDLSATGAAVIKEAAKATMKAKAGGVVVTGHTDKAGSDDYNKGLSRARAAAVVNALMAEGIARDSVKRMYSGEAAPEVMTKDGTKEARNRRVTISFTR